MKIGNKVTVTNTNSKQYGIEGEIVLINGNRAQVELNGGCGTWGFNLDDLTILGGQSKAVKPIETEIVINVSTEADKPLKRAYNRSKDKPKEVKEKRKYTKRTPKNN